MRRSCAFSTSFAVLACRKVVPPPTAGTASPCSRSVVADGGDGGLGHGFSAWVQTLSWSSTDPSSRLVACPKPRRRCCHPRGSNEAAGGLGLLDRATREADPGSVLALAQTLHAALRLSIRFRCLSS